MLVAQKRAKRESNVIYGFVSLANIFETNAKSKTTNRASGEERPPCNTLKSSFSLHTLKNEKCETPRRRSGRQQCEASCGFFEGSHWLFTVAVPLRITKSSFMSPRLDSYFAKIANRVGEEKEGRRWPQKSFINSQSHSLRSREIFSNHDN